MKRLVALFAFSASLSAASPDLGIRPSTSWALDNVNSKTSDDAMLGAVAAPAYRPLLTDLAAMGTSGPSTVIVQQEYSGGEFKRVAAATYTATAGIVYNGVGCQWARTAWVNRERLNVLWFGALPTGAPDQTPAFQAAVDASLLLKSRCVYIPRGTYQVNGTVTIPSVNVTDGQLVGLTIEGDGAGKSSSYIQADGIKNTFEVIDTDMNRVTFRNLMIEDETVTAGFSGFAIHVENGATDFIFDNILITGYLTDSASHQIAGGIRMRQFNGASFRDCIISGNECGVVFDNGAQSEQSINFWGGRIQGNSYAGIWSDFSQNINLWGTDLSINGDPETGIGYALYMLGLSHSINLQGCYVELGRTLGYFNNVKFVNIQGCYIVNNSPPAGSALFVFENDSDDVNISNNFISNTGALGGSSDRILKVDADCDRIFCDVAKLGNEGRPRYTLGLESYTLNSPNFSSGGEPENLLSKPLDDLFAWPSGGYTVTSEAVAAQDGSVNQTFLVNGNAKTGNVYLPIESVALSPTVASGDRVVFSWWVMAGTSTTLRFAYQWAYSIPGNAAFTTVPESSGTSPMSADGWSYYEMTEEMPAETDAVQLQISPEDDGGGNANMYVWGVNIRRYRKGIVYPPSETGLVQATEMAEYSTGISPDGYTVLISGYGVPTSTAPAGSLYRDRLNGLPYARVLSGTTYAWQSMPPFGGIGASAPTVIFPGTMWISNAVQTFIHNGTVWQPLN